ncbi:MAG: alpha-amylase family glycosyl hydrolase [Chloroflexota bacterium]|nr:alpha-amylase family glycosyl hydrolase [Chloroflexota bacterium]
MRSLRIWLAVCACVLALALALPAAAQEQADWWHDTVFYEIFVRSFYDSDGDGVGDFNGVTERLDYLNDGDPATTDDLGVTGLWLMPIMESPSYHGYDVTNYNEVEPDYGTMADFERLVSEAHSRGIRVIIDLPFNHSSREHPWFVESQAGAEPYNSWYLWEERSPGWKGPQNQTVWHAASGRYYYALFWEGMPDLNYTNPDVTAEMTRIAQFWLDKGVDGFRLDGVKHVIEEGRDQENTAATVAWLTDYRAAIRAIDPDALIVAEIWSSTFEVAPYVESGAVDLAFEFDLATAALQSAGNERASSVRNIQARALRQFNGANYAPFLTNHDQNRVMFGLRDEDKARTAARLLLTSPGVPFIYYGEEIGMTGAKPDERIRTPMQWTDDDENAGFTTGRPWQGLQSDLETANVAVQTDQAGSLLDTYRTMIRLRGALGLGRGTWRGVESEADAVYSFVHMSDDADAPASLVVINLSDEPIADYTLTYDGDLGGRATATGYDGLDSAAGASQPILSTDGGFVAYQPTPGLAPYEVLVVWLAR